jgi:hypothetical protein
MDAKIILLSRPERTPKQEKNQQGTTGNEPDRPHWNYHTQHPIGL